MEQNTEGGAHVAADRGLVVKGSHELLEMNSYKLLRVIQQMTHSSAVVGRKV